MAVTFDSPPGTSFDEVVLVEPRPSNSRYLRAESLQIVTLPARLFLALGWLRAASEKLIDVNWWTGYELDVFLIEQRPRALPFMQPVIDRVFTPTVLAIAAIVMVAEFAIGLALARAKHMRTALVAGITLNVVFVLLGVVTPSAFYLILQVTLLVALGERTNDRVTLRQLWGRAIACLVAALAMLPFATTLHPAEVIEDPALMLATVAGLCASVDLLRIAHIKIGHE